MVAALWSGVVWGQDWPQWRGPEGTGRVPAGVAVPEKLPAAAKVVWRAEVGDGVASPVVSGGRVFYLDHQQGKEVAHAAEAGTGRVLWSVVLDEVHKDTQSTPGPRTTPTADGERVYVQSCRGELQCLNAADGKVVWRTHFVKDFGAEFIGEAGSAAGAMRHGYTGSPVVDGERLIVGVGGKGASVVCFDKKDGKVIWKSQSDIPGYAPVVVATIGGVKQIVAFTIEGVMGLDAAEGKLLWRHGMKTTFGRHATTPVVVEEMVIVSSHEVGLVGVKITREGSAFKAEEAWKHKELAINFASPVAAGSYVYGLGPAKNVICVESKTGKLAWSKEGLVRTAGWRAYAGMMVMGRNILMLTDGGELVMFAAEPEAFRLIGRTQVCGQNWCNPAYAEGRLYLRDGKEMRCVELMP